ncbi:RNA-directed DNA polymerase, eukaryota, reverse transcriptase zinc-binding domain protein [Tanacetum coccineum]|uniref:RNA-directed DNA polymerase, eukaryota, reverse transcriptase zinc-binding domain protein n=1 Tax=Tanacetum coccineum TaxID=301880 RepID=A0ABQ5HWB8_9ASTR
MTNTTKQDEVKLLINEEKISMCAVIETQVSKKLVNKVGDYVFGNWAWVSNSVDSNRGCRIMDHRKHFVSFVYAKNTERERKPLWRNLTDHCVLVNGEPWAVLGDFNVTTKVEECSDSFNVIDKDMEVFRRVLCNLELEDITSYAFLSSYGSCFAKFLPYVTSDHCPATLVHPDIKAIKPRSFRFMNFLADKPGFLRTVKDNWCLKIQGFRMLVLAKRLKNMKKHLRNLNRINGNVFDKLKALRVELKRVQSSLDKDPNCVHLREEEYVYCNAYKDAASDEEKGRMYKSRIEVVYDTQGNKYEGDDVASKFVEHFQKNLGSEDEVFPIEGLDSLFVKKLDSQCAASMIRPVLDDEIKHAMFSIEDDKAAGPDGFTSKFFKAAWSVVGSDVCFAVKDFFFSSKLLGEFNANLISLVPKLQTPLKITDYRPIACGNVVYKCISKVIVNRLKEGLSSIIDCNQSAFIPGRQISDNILLAQEFMNGYNCKGGALRCAFKVDIEKAYDTGKRGLRQGDPMSPYLFTIVMEVFNLMVQRHIRLDNRFKYHWGCSRIRLTHLCFADDLLMLCHGDHISASILRRALDEFSMTFGLYPNMSKSMVFYGNVHDTVKDEIQLVMPFREGVLPVRYLGIPLTAKTLSIADCRVLIEKNFVWSKNDATKGAWKDVCRPKEEGGLGLKSLKVMNHALMVKHLWNIASKKDSLWVKWLNMYRIKGNCIWDLKVKKNFSWNLKQILSLRDSIRRNVGYKIGNGRGCFIWYDRWHSNGPICRLISNDVIKSSGFNLNAKVADLVSNNNWNWPNDWSVRFKEVVDVPVPVLDQDRDDMALWFDKQNVEVRFSVKEVWRVLRPDVPKVLWHKHVWFSQCIPRHSFIIWMAIKGRLKTQDRISRWFNVVNMLCPFCKKEKNSHGHLFFGCDFAQGVWNTLKVMSRLDDISCVWAQIISGITIRKANNSIWSIIQRLVLGAAVYFIWQERNFRLFRGNVRSAETVTSMIIDTVRLRLLGLKIKHSCEVVKVAVIWNLPWKAMVGEEARNTDEDPNDGVTYGSATYSSSGYGVLGIWGSSFFGNGLGSVSGFMGYGLDCISLYCDHFKGSGSGLWKCNTIFIIDKGLWMDCIVFWSSGFMVSMVIWHQGILRLMIQWAYIHGRLPLLTSKGSGYGKTSGSMVNYDSVDYSSAWPIMSVFHMFSIRISGSSFGSLCLVSNQVCVNYKYKDNAEFAYRGYEDSASKYKRSKKDFKLSSCSGCFKSLVIPAQRK